MVYQRDRLFLTESSILFERMFRFSNYTEAELNSIYDHIKERTNISRVRDFCKNAMGNVNAILGITYTLCETRVGTTSSLGMKYPYIRTKFTSQEVLVSSGLVTGILKKSTVSEKQVTMIQYLEAAYPQILTDIANGMSNIHSLTTFIHYDTLVKYYSDKILFLLNECGSDLLQGYHIQHQHQAYQDQERRMENMMARKLYLFVMCGGCLIYPFVLVAEYIQPVRRESRRNRDDITNFW